MSLAGLERWPEFGKGTGGIGNMKKNRVQIDKYLEDSRRFEKIRSHPDSSEQQNKTETPFETSVKKSQE